MNKSKQIADLCEGGQHPAALGFWIVDPCCTLRPSCMQVGNIQLGVPVRVTRRNEEKDALSGYVLIYDGLYDVVSSSSPAHAKPETSPPECKSHTFQAET